MNPRHLWLSRCQLLDLRNAEMASVRELRVRASHRSADNNPEQLTAAAERRVGYVRKLDEALAIIERLFEQVSDDDQAAPVAWNYERYWRLVFGPMAAKDVIDRFMLTSTSSLDAWIYRAEAETWRESGQEEKPELWAVYHARALSELGDVIKYGQREDSVRP